MTNYYCLVCASDEGVFLDVLANTSNVIEKQLRTCLSIKISEQQQLSNKICHKCAYELNQCNIFIENYKQSRKILHKELIKEKSCCIFCAKPGKKGLLFDLSKDKRTRHKQLFNSCEVFKDYPIFSQECTLICLTCRYTVDLLLDLKTISQESESKLRDLIEYNANYLNIPKTKTFVARRKTTTKRLTIRKDDTSDSDTNTMARGQSCAREADKKRTASTMKNRLCDECRNVIKNGIDMYRFHRTGLTVCKNCWATMDPGKYSTGNKTKDDKVVTKDTKRCSVFLEDVLLNKTTRGEHAMKMEVDKEGNKIYIISDGSSEEEVLHMKKKVCKDTASDANSKTQSVTEKRSLRSTRSSSQSLDDNKSPKKMKVEMEKVVKRPDKTKDVKHKVTYKLRDISGSKNKIRSFTSSDSEITVTYNLRGTTEKRTKRANVSDIESDARRKRVKNDIMILLSKNSDGSEESSSNEEINSNRRVTRFSRHSPSMDGANIRKTKRFRSHSMSSKEMSSPEFKCPSQKSTKPSKLKQKETSTVNNTETDNISDSQSHTCEECGAVYENKLAGMTHELTHCKRLELKLEKIEASVTKEEMVESCQETEKIHEKLDESSEVQGCQVDDSIQQDEKGKDSEDSADKETTMTKTATETNVDESTTLETTSDVSFNVQKEEQVTDKTIVNMDHVVEDETTDVDVVNLNVNDDEQQENAEEVIKVNEEVKVNEETTIPKELPASQSADDEPILELQTSEQDTVSKRVEESNNIEVGTMDKDDQESTKRKDDELEKEKIVCDDSNNITTNEDTQKIVEEVSQDFQERGGDKKENVEDMVQNDLQLENVSDVKIVDTDNLANSTNDDSALVKISEVEQVEEEDEEDNNDIIHLKADDENLLSDVAENEKQISEESKSKIALDTPLDKEDTVACLSEQNVHEESESNNSSIAATDVLREVFDLATAEVQKRLDDVKAHSEKEVDSVEETLENISRELRNGGDMPSLDPIHTAESEKKQKCAL